MPRQFVDNKNYHLFRSGRHLQVRWLAMTEPLLADMSSSSARWWRILTKEGYSDQLKLPPIEASPSEELKQVKWARLERRVSSMLLMAVPQTVREELYTTGIKKNDNWRLRRNVLRSRMHFRGLADIEQRTCNGLVGTIPLTRICRSESL